MSPHARFVLLVAWSGLALGCEVQGNDPKADPVPAKVGAADLDWDGVALRSHRDAPSALRFPIPATGYRVRATHFDPSTPPIKMKHEISILRERSEVIRVDVWNDSEGLGLNAWFEKYLRFMATPDATVETTRAGKVGASSIVVLQPRSEQATARRHVITEIDGRVLRVTVTDADDARAGAIFDRISADLEVEAAR
jgi:hypothetical protein